MVVGLLVMTNYYSYDFPFPDINVDIKIDAVVNSFMYINAS